MEDMSRLYQQHAQTVYKFLLAQCRDAHLAEELTQETFYQAIRSVDRFHGAGPVAGGPCQSATHLWDQHLRKHRREAAEGPPETVLPSAEEETLAQEGQLELLRKIHALSPDAREVVYLRSFGGLSFREIGDVCGRTETWARVTFYRSKELLRTGGTKDEK